MYRHVHISVEIYGALLDVGLVHYGNWATGLLKSNKLSQNHFWVLGQTSWISLSLQWRQISAMASQITSLMIVYSTVYSGADQRKRQNSASLVFVRGRHRWPVVSPHKGPVTRKMFPFDDVIMRWMEQKLLKRQNLLQRNRYEGNYFNFKNIIIRE